MLALSLTLMMSMPLAAQTAPPPVEAKAPVDTRPRKAKPRHRTDVRVFERFKPRDAYVVVDRITVTPSDTPRANEMFHQTTDQELRDALRVEAGRMGGDGVIDLKFDTIATSTSKERAHLTQQQRERVNATKRILSGTVIRFNEAEKGVGTRKGVILFFGNEMPPFDFDEMMSIEVDASDIPGRGGLFDFSAVSRRGLLGALLNRADIEDAFALVGVEVVDIGGTIEQVQNEQTELSLSRRHFRFQEGKTTTTETKVEKRVARGIIIRRRR